MEPKEKLGISSDGRPMHYSVETIIKRDGKYLLIDRNQIPYGFASVAGHIDEGETPEVALKREILEESGLKLKSFKLLFEEEIGIEPCSRGIVVHHSYVYECDVEGEPYLNTQECKSIGWYTVEEMKKLKLQALWKYIFEKLEII